MNKILKYIKEKFCKCEDCKENEEIDVNPNNIVITLVRYNELLETEKKYNEAIVFNDDLHIDGDIEVRGDVTATGEISASGDVVAYK